jgi:predicted nucleic acid-binding protein
LSFLLDTNILSELRKGERGDLGVRSWIREVPSDALFVSVLVTRNIRDVERTGAECLNPFEEPT